MGHEGDHEAARMEPSPQSPQPRTLAAAPSRERSAQLRQVLVAARDCPDAARQRRMRGSVIIEYIPVARSIAARYARRGVDRADLEQLANLGLLKAVRGWRPGESEDFLQYAVPTMVGEIKRYFRDHTHEVRPPRRVQELRPVLADAEQQHWQQHGARPSDGELAAAMGSTAEQVREAKGAMNLCRPSSLEKLNDASSPATAGLGDDDPRYTHVEDQMTVQRLMAGLTDSERRIIDLRFGQELSQSQIGARIGVSQMQVSRLLKAILAKLNQAAAA